MITFQFELGRIWLSILRIYVSLTLILYSQINWNCFIQNRTSGVIIFLITRLYPFLSSSYALNCFLYCCFFAAKIVIKFREFDLLLNRRIDAVVDTSLFKSDITFFDSFRFKIFTSYLPLASYRLAAEWFSDLTINFIYGFDDWIERKSSILFYCLLRDISIWRQSLQYIMTFYYSRPKEVLDNPL